MTTYHDDWGCNAKQRCRRIKRYCPSWFEMMWYWTGLAIFYIIAVARPALACGGLLALIISFYRKGKKGSSKGVATCTFEAGRGV
jgi:hypothetical protein